MAKTLFPEGIAPLVEGYLRQSSAMHSHACPRQVLGIRMGLLAGRLLDIPVPQTEKRLLTIAETDGCAVDGIGVATNCWVGRRTLRIEDYGKVAATFVDTKTSRAVRIVPSEESRTAALAMGGGEGSRFERYLAGYMVLPEDLLFLTQPVELRTPVEKIISKMSKRAFCARCGEEINNEREVVNGGLTLCQSCAGHSYYGTLPEMAQARLVMDSDDDAHASHDH